MFSTTRLSAREEMMRFSGTCRVALFAMAILTCHATFAQDEPELTIERLSDTISVLFGQGGNIGVFAGIEGTFIIDDQFDGNGERITQAVATLSDRPIDFVLNTHWHWDHAGSNEFFSHGGSTIIAHDNVRKRLKDGMYMSLRDLEVPPAPAAALPVITFNESLSLHLDGEEILMFYVTAGHTSGDGMVWFKGSNIIHMGDNFLSGVYPIVDVDDGGSLDGMISTVNTVLEFVDDETKIIPGHGPVGDKAMLRAYRDMCVTLRDRITDMKGRGMTVDEMIEANVTEGLDDVWNTWGDRWKKMSIESLYAAIP
jgi:glyoxylase-like metal-dependent hydrolase (beta-lactamase superfamily II)